MDLLDRTPVRLNLGAGSKVHEGWISVGLEESHDVRADVRMLPLADDYADEAMAIHVLEHLYRWDALNALKEWFRVLKPGGMLAIEQPELTRCCRAVLTNPDPRAGVLGLFGDPFGKNELMMHKWCWTYPELKAELKAAGFRKVRAAAPLFHGKRTNRDMRIEAWK